MTAKQLFSDYSESDTLPWNLQDSELLRWRRGLQLLKQAREEANRWRRPCLQGSCACAAGAGGRWQRQLGLREAEHTPPKTDVKGDYSLSEDDKDEHEEFPEFLGGGLAKFYDFLAFPVTTSSRSQTRLGESERHGSNQRMRAAFHSARAAVKLLPTKICA